MNLESSVWSVADARGRASWVISFAGNSFTFYQKTPCIIKLYETQLLQISVHDIYGNVDATLKSIYGDRYQLAFVQ